LIFTIKEQRDRNREKASTVFGEFTDNTNKVYYFYSEQVYINAEKNTLINTLPTALLIGEHINEQAVNDFEAKVRESNDNKIKLNLLPQNNNTSMQYSDKLNSNIGYLIATIVDMINVIYQSKEGKS
jgi:hypothetical protein